ncbi:hypothetical protein JW707_01160 [Candidatus Woesearchaeota archaeon]|nr:hypothetical protein [Candidatus Woesearchaeota archaeon]
MDKKGHYAFLVGVLLAVVAALIPSLQAAAWLPWVLIVLGLIVGFLNITAKETTEFLVATIALMAVGTGGLSAVPSAGAIVLGILKNLVAFVAPAALVVALKAIYALAGE